MKYDKYMINHTYNNKSCPRSFQNYQKSDWDEENHQKDTI